MDTDVLIVGAGPTGLMLACQLARRGVGVEIVDRHSGPAQQSRALGVQARTLEIYAQLGIAERAVELGKKGTGATLWAQGRRMAHVPLGNLGGTVTPYPFILVLGQDDNELIMGEKLGELGVTVRWNTELTELTQHADHVSATLKQPDGSSRTVSAAYIAGCDGAHSAVRKLSGIGFPGAPYEHVFFVADVEMTGTMAPDEINVYFWRSGFHLLFPMRGADHWRIVGIVPRELRDVENLDLDAIMPSLRKEAGASLSIRNCSWFSTYRIHHRAAERFRDRRAFILGDAAHIHSPVGAQGMNTGLQDAYNLAWKLALAVRGEADPALLDSYNEERLPVARRLLATTDRGFKLVVSDSWLAGLLRTQILARIAAFAMSIERVRQFAFRTVSQTGIGYRDSSLSKAIDTLPASAPQSGDRFPWMHLELRPDGPAEDTFKAFEDRCFNLLAFGQSVPDGPGFGAIVKSWTVPTGPRNDAELARVGIPRLSFYLIRPDGHVGLCGTTADATAIRRYLAETIRYAAARIPV
ncbi:FAD-dependent oxidoreductase [Mesorhizobium sp. KR9-304]|uniref:FAD-dependent oxidoreductase n=1 Tax=Mesorhizobium sp. KR9-304 TaxID=3156614 RepID=UPI0032B33E64